MKEASPKQPFGPIAFGKSTTRSIREVEVFGVQSATKQLLSEYTELFGFITRVKRLLQSWSFTKIKKKDSHLVDSVSLLVHPRSAASLLDKQK